MNGHTSLEYLLAHAQPRLDATEYVFASFPGARYADLAWMKPLASIQEEEGLSLVIERETAELAGISTEVLFCRISFEIHSSLEAVGFTVAISSKLAEKGICANIMAGFFHDHVFVPSARAGDALLALMDLT